MKTAAATDKIITYSFCESYKDNLLKYIQGEFIDKGADLSRLAIVFGGKRPAMFLKRDLAYGFGKSFYPPTFFTIDNFVQHIVKKGTVFCQPQDLDNCFLLYELAKKVTPEILEKRETFVKFLPWIREILKFIDQLDLENIQDKALQNIQANAEIGYGVPDDINQLLQRIIVLRQAYHNELQKSKSYSRGLQYLTAARIVDDHAFDEFDQILFCNFFYFHRTEERIVKSLYERGKATLIFQGDQRKWPVLQRISKMFNCSIREGEQPDKPSFALKLYSGFNIHSQVALVREALNDIKPLDKTVIVLPEPDHIIPLLSEISSSISEYNISMGYPLKRSSLYSLFELIFKAQASLKEGRYYTKDYLKALRHPFIKNLKLSSNMTATRILIHKIEEILTGKAKTEISGSLFIRLEDITTLDKLTMLTCEMLKRLGINTGKEELESMLNEIHDHLFVQWEGVTHFQGFASALDRFLNKLVDKSFLKNYPLNLNIATKIYAVKDEFSHASFAGEQFDREEMFRIFEHKMAHEKIAFTGSPLKGLQILGLLETRALNFDHVIILDTNEGVLPRLNIHEPLIPREVMISLGLDRLELEEEIQRYQFMRLISSAKNVHLIYQESKDKERSRFIEELMWEEQKKYGELRKDPVVRPSFQMNIEPVKKTIRKTPEMIEFLRSRAYSASSINMYLRNPMDFYTSYVLGLKEEDDLLDEPEVRHVGSFLHKLLKEGFGPLLNKKPKIDRAFRDRFMSLFDKNFEETFGKTMKSDSFLLRAVIFERISRFLDNEQFNEERQVEEILYLEKDFKGTITMPVGDIKFKYVFDRIDRCQDGTIMVIDYKSGNTDFTLNIADKISSLELSRESIYKNIKSFQVPLYYHYLGSKFPDDSVNAALYDLRTLKLNKFINAKTVLPRSKINEAYLKALNFIIEEIFDPEVPFEEITRESFF